MKIMLAYSLHQLLPGYKLSQTNSTSLL